MELTERSSLCFSLLLLVLYMHIVNRNRIAQTPRVDELHRFRFSAFISNPSCLHNSFADGSPSISSGDCVTHAWTSSTLPTRLVASMTGSEKSLHRRSSQVGFLGFCNSFGSKGISSNFFAPTTKRNQSSQFKLPRHYEFFAHAELNKWRATTCRLPDRASHNPATRL